MSEVLHIYRRVLRAIIKNVASVDNRRQLTYFARQQFSEAAKRADGAAGEGGIRGLLQDAEDYAFLVESIKYHKELLLSYNVGIPFDQREKHMNAKAAEFVGLRLPAAPESPQIVP